MKWFWGYRHCFFRHYIPCRLSFIWVSLSPPTNASARLCFTVLILEECWPAVRRLAVLLLSDISLQLHSGSQEAESQGNHSIGCVIRMTNQSIFLVNLWHHITELLKCDGIDMGYWDRVFVNKEISLGKKISSPDSHNKLSCPTFLLNKLYSWQFCFFVYSALIFSHWSTRRTEGNSILLSICAVDNAGILYGFYKN